MVGHRPFLPFDRSEARRHHQTVTLLDEIVGFVGEFQIILPFWIAHHGAAPFGAIAGIFESPQVHKRINVAALAVKISERGPEMPRLCIQAILGVELELLCHLARSYAIGADIHEHVSLLCLTNSTRRAIAALATRAGSNTLRPEQRRSAASHASVGGLVFAE